MEYQDWMPFLLFGLAQLVALSGFVYGLLNKNFSKLETAFNEKLSAIENIFANSIEALKKEVEAKSAAFHEALLKCVCIEMCLAREKYENKMFDLIEIKLRAISAKLDILS